MRPPRGWWATSRASKPRWKSKPRRPNQTEAFCPLDETHFAIHKPPLTWDPGQRLYSFLRKLIHKVIPGPSECQLNTCLSTLQPSLIHYCLLNISARDNLFYNKCTIEQQSLELSTIMRPSESIPCTMFGIFACLHLFALVCANLRSFCTFLRSFC